MECIVSSDNWELFRYRPSIIKPFYIEMEKMSVASRIRFLIDFLYGYRVYYLKAKDNLVGYCTITSGKNPRFWFANENDIIIGPYYVDERFRGMGYCKKMVDCAINECEKTWNNAYIYIKNTNYPSIHVAENLNAKLIFYVHNTRLRKLVKSDMGEYGVYKINRG